MENNQTNVTTPTLPTENAAGFSESPAGGKAGKVVKYIIFLLFAIIFLIELGFGIKTLKTPSASGIVKSSPMVLQAGASLVPLATSIKKGDRFSVSINLNSGGSNSLASDIYLKYDPALLSLDNPPFKKGSVYADYPLVSASAPGILKVSGLILPGGKDFNGQGVFGTVNFIAKAPGEAQISIQYDPKNPALSSRIVQTGTAANLLTSGVLTNIDIR